MKKKTHDEFIENLFVVNPKVDVLEKYVNAKTKIKIKCKKCNQVWSATPSNLLNGYGCPNCYGTPKKTNEQFIKELKEKNPDVLPLEKYVDAKTKIKLKCNICGHVWYNTPNSILSGRRCPMCFGTPKKTNKKFLEEMREKKPYVEVLEEYNDAHTKLMFKCKKCNHKWKDSPLIILHKGLCPNCHQSLSTEKTLKNYNIYYYGNEVKTHENFVKEVAKTSPKIEVIGKYKSRTQKIKVRCRECGHEWDTYPYNLLKGHGCPKCTGIYKKTTKEYIKQLKSINNEIEVIGKYIGARDKIKVKCKVCNHVWEPAAGSLLAGHGCPKKKLHNNKKISISVCD